jgi:hypothetical protein
VQLTSWACIVLFTVLALLACSGCRQRQSAQQEVTQGIFRVLDRSAFKAFDGEYPEAWPADVELPAGCELEGGVIPAGQPGRREGSARAWELRGLVARPKEEVLQAFRQEFEEDGFWLDIRAGGSDQGHWTRIGFRESPPGNYCHVSFGVNDNTGDTGLTYFTLHLDSDLGAR